MNDLADNFLVRFIALKKKKEGLFANFKVKGMKGGVFFTTTISVDLAVADVHPGDPLEKIVDLCSKMAVKEFKKSDLQFEGIPSAL